MRTTKITVTAALAAAAVAVATGSTASAEPVSPAPAVAQYQGADQGIDYKLFLSDAGNAITTTVGAGAFALAGDTVTLTDDSGALIAQIPLVHQADQQLTVAPSIADNGRTLTLVPNANGAALADIDAQQWFYYELNRAAPGAAVGALIGAAIGVFFLGIGIIPGAAIGALIGLLVAGGQPLIDSGFAFLQPR